VANNLPSATVLTLGDASNHSGVLDLYGNNQQVAALASVGGGVGNAITNSVTSNVTFTINTTTSTVYAGAFGDNAGGSLSLTKSGTAPRNSGGPHLYGDEQHYGGRAGHWRNSALGQVSSVTPNKVWINGGTLAAATAPWQVFTPTWASGSGPPTARSPATATRAFANGSLTING